MLFLFPFISRLHHCKSFGCDERAVARWEEDYGEGARRCVSYRFEANPSRRFFHYAAEDNDTAYHRLSVREAASS